MTYIKKCKTFNANSNDCGIVTQYLALGLIFQTLSFCK